MKFLPYGKQYIDQDDIDAVAEVLCSDWLTQGPKIKEFETMIAAYHSCRYAVAFANGTAALHGAYYVSTKFPFGKSNKTVRDIGEFIRAKKPEQRAYEHFRNQYWEFITTPITFVATANGGLYCGGCPKFVDVDLNTYCIDIAKIEEQITEDTRVIAPVSYAGYPVDVEAIRNLPKVQENNICIIHDACHAIGAIRNGQGIADSADMTILSFHPVKHITTGEGGMVLTNNKDYYEKLILFRNHGISRIESEFQNHSDGDWYYEMQELGYNYRITDIQCALGISQMKKLNLFLLKRNQIAKQYEILLNDISWITLPPGFSKEWIDNTSYDEPELNVTNLHSYHLFPILLDDGIDRKRFFDYMRRNNVGVQIHYIPIISQPVYTGLQSVSNDAYSTSGKLYSSIVSLPMYYGMDMKDVDRISGLIKNYKKNI